MTGFFEAKTRLPVFEDADLKVPTRLHSRRCKSRLDEEGKPVSLKKRPCNCVLRWIDKGDLVEGKEASEIASFIRPLFGNLSNVYVEKRGLAPVIRQKVEDQEAKKPSPADRIPKDAVLAEELIAAMKEVPKEIRDRKRTPKGGELVFLRSEIEASRSGGEKPQPWRYFGSFGLATERQALLLDARIATPEALSMSHQRSKHLRIDGKLCDVVACLFPWPGAKEARWR